MYLKIQFKLFVLLLLLIFFLAAGILFISQSQKKQIFTIAKDQHKQLQVFIDEILNLKGKSLYTVVFDYTYWDEMVDFAKDPASAERIRWAQENIGGALSTYNIQQAWVLNKEKKEVFEIRDPSSGSTFFPLASEDFPSVFSGGSFGHFYYWDKEGLLEVRGATIHPGSDIARRTSPQGYFFVARRWDKRFLEELSELLDGKVTLVMPFFNSLAKDAADFTEKKVFDKMYFKRELNSFHDKPIAVLIIERPFVLASYLQAFSQGYRRFYAGASIVFVIIFFLFGLFWISMPLSKISQALYSEDQFALKGLSKSHSEFGRISELIIRFFKQKEKLLKEILERRRTQRRLKDAQAQLLQSEKMVAVGQLSSGIAHEIRNPLGNIVLAVDCLRQELPTLNESVSRQMDIIQKSAARANKIVMELLSFAKEKTIKLEKVSLNTMLLETLSLAESYIKSKNIFIEKNFWNDKEIMINIDRLLVEQALINFIFNAVDAIEHRGMITINTFFKEKKEKKKDFVDIEIADTGRGMTPEIKKKIFDPFFTTKELGFGTGLGLSNAYIILERHGAQVQVTSELDKGTKFLITFPCEIKII
ncbi:MAG: ATP-binding protein [Candidatus Omnitrophota bacterium]